MKIIKQGKTKEVVEAILRHTKRFKCNTCGCIFEANDDEYEYHMYTDVTCKCPNCGQNARGIEKNETIEVRRLIR